MRVFLSLHAHQHLLLFVYLFTCLFIYTGSDWVARLASNSRFSCLSLPSAGITGVPFVGANSGTVPVWVGIRPYDKAPRNWGKSLRTRLCLCDLVSGIVRKPDVQKNSVQGSQMASCPSDVNKKVILTMCFSCFSVPILFIYFFCSHFKGDITELISTVLPRTNVTLKCNTWHTFSDQMCSV
jgi:hypothetical protein